MIISIRDFKIIEPPEPEDEILMQIEHRVPPGTGKIIVNSQDEMITISEFKERFLSYDGSNRLWFMNDYTIWILVGIADEKGNFFCLNELPHRKNIEFFEISVRYEAHYRGKFDLM